VKKQSPLRRPWVIEDENLINKIRNSIFQTPDGEGICPGSRIKGYGEVVDVQPEDRALEAPHGVDVQNRTAKLPKHQLEFR